MAGPIVWSRLRPTDFLRNFSWQFLFTHRVFARNLVRGNRRRNTFRILFWCLAWASNPGFSSNKLTHYLLDHGDFTCPGSLVGRNSGLWHSTEHMIEVTQLVYRVHQIPFFFGNALTKKLLNIFANFFFYLKVQSFRLITENNFIQMAASAGHAVAYTIGWIFKHIVDCVQLYFTNVVL